jgi:hypothetical protein
MQRELDAGLLRDGNDASQEVLEVLPERPSVARLASGRSGAALIAAWSYSVVSAPPRSATARPVRAQL